MCSRPKTDDNYFYNYFSVRFPGVTTILEHLVNIANIQAKLFKIHK